eukprot:4289356-Amphidinium_carterae.1
MILARAVPESEMFLALRCECSTTKHRSIVILALIEVNTPTEFRQPGASLSFCAICAGQRCWQHRPRHM